MVRWDRLWEEFKRVLGRLPLEGVHANFFFSWAKDEVYESFKRAFGIKAEIPDYVWEGREIYEVGEGEWRGMKITVFGPHKKNPNYREPPSEEREREFMRSMLRSASEVLWEGIAKDLLEFDTEKMEALFRARDLDWKKFYGYALRLYRGGEGDG